MRVALVSPYSWTYPGGVTRHVEALSGALLAAGHDVRILAPSDPDDRRSARLHRGAAPQPRPLPEHLVSLGRTVGFPANGAVSNLAITPTAVSTLRTELSVWRPDVVHVHEPVAPVVGWDALCATDLPLVGTFHAHATKVAPHAVASLIGARRRLNRLHVRLAVSRAAAWTGERFYGGRYRVVPNGVDLAAFDGPRPTPTPGAALRILFVGQAVERKGLPVLARAFEALRAVGLACELELVGVDRDEASPLFASLDGVRILGKVDDAEKAAALRRADVLCAPSLGGESFGMVLTEAFAAGVPVVCSDIAGYRDVCRHGVEGLLVPRGDGAALGEALHDLALDPAQRARLGVAARERAERYAWPRVAAEVAGAYEDAVAVAHERPRAAPTRRAAEVLGLASADGGPPAPARRMPAPDLPATPQPAGAPARSGRSRPRVPVAVRRAGLALASLAGLALAFVALQRIGFERIGEALVTAKPAWVLGSLALFCASMLLRAVAWHAILNAALGPGRAKLADATQGTMIGVLMSATLPARLGEPARALVVSRRLGLKRETLPVVLGTIVSQTLLNILALVILGVTMVSTVDLFQENGGALAVITIAPLLLLASVLLAPVLLRGAEPRSARLGALLARARAAAASVRDGLRVFRSPKLGAIAVSAQLGAWALQWLGCFVLLVSFGLDGRGASLFAAAAVLFAVNVTAVLPATPSNLGVFQAATVAVLAGAYGIPSAEALGYGIMLQAVELATAFIMGAPALVKEGTSWREVRLRALHHAPVELRRREPAAPAGLDA